jgi:hypothetical protein
MTLIDDDQIYEEIKNRIKCVNTFYHSVRNILWAYICTWSKSLKSPTFQVQNLDWRCKIWGFHCGDYWRIASSGMLRRVDLVRTDVSEERSASKTSAVTRSTRRNIPEDAIFLDWRFSKGAPCVCSSIIFQNLLTCSRHTKHSIITRLWLSFSQYILRFCQTTSHSTFHGINHRVCTLCNDYQPDDPLLEPKFVVHLRMTTRC